MDIEEITKAFAEAHKKHVERKEKLIELKHPQKFNKEYYLKLKKTVFNNISELIEEIQLWKDVKDRLLNEDDQSQFLPSRLAEIMKKQKKEALDSLDDLIEALEEEINRDLDVLNKTNEIVKLLQSELKRMPPYMQIQIQCNPNSKVDMSILEIEIKEINK